MHLLVTGVSGLLGARLVRLLAAAGHQVRGSYRPGDDVSLAAPMLDEAVACDLLDREGTARLVDGVDAVLHVAAMVTFDPALYWQQVRVNVQGTRVLIEACLRAKVKRLVHTSTVNTLGIPADGEVGDEGTASNWGRFRLGYMDSKLWAEQEVLTATRHGDLETVAVLPGTLFGPWDVNFNGGAYIKAAARGLLMAAPSGGTSVVHVDDVAAGHLLALERGISNETYILGGENLTYRELFALIAAEVGKPGPRFTLPLHRLRPLGRLADQIRERTGLPIPLQEGLLTAAASKLFYSSDKAKRELGYSVRPAREAIRDAVAWYRDEGLI